jgi:hypothetical protein
MNLLRRNWFPSTAGFICFLYAFIAWLTVKPNQDILADGIQAQSLISDPRLVLAFPGQKHAGPLEYPFTVLAEWLFPGNFFANAAIRPVLAFVTGFLVAKLFVSLFSMAPKWSLLLALVVGPPIMHAYIGPANAVGVWWMQPNWDMAWLFVTAGALVLSNQLKARNSSSAKVRGTLILAGVLLALGFYAHPAISLLLVPLVALVLMRTQRRLWDLLWVILGGIIGVIPAAISYVVNARVNTWDPSHGAFISLSYYKGMGASVLGLDSIPDHMLGLLPYGIGLPPDQTLISGSVQSVIVGIFLMAVIVGAVVSVVFAIKNRRRVTPAGSLAVAWLVAVFTMFAFITFVDPVWLYSSGLAILFWISLGALPIAFRSPVVGATVTVGLAILVLAGTLSQGRSYFTDLISGYRDKIESQRESRDVATFLLSGGAQFVYGSYYDAIPVGYASGGKLRTITNHYNRFPITSDELERGSVRVGVSVQPKEEWGDEALALVRSRCQEDIRTNDQGEFRIFVCPTEALVTD